LAGPVNTAARAEKVKSDAEQYQQAHIRDIGELEDMERTCAYEMRTLLKVRAVDILYGMECGAGHENVHGAGRAVARATVVWLVSAPISMFVHQKVVRNPQKLC
jgi:hypothetical protein